MTTISNLIHTSASDAKITLERELDQDPLCAARVALDLLQELQGKEGHASRRKVAGSILRKAAKALEAGS